MVSLDIAKAFDSVSHATIRETLMVMGLPDGMVEYIADVYARSTTFLSCNTWISNKVQPTCDVKQDDPMSPVIFNIIMDRVLRTLSEDVGAKVGDLTLNHSFCR